MNFAWMLAGWAVLVPSTYAALDSSQVHPTEMKKTNTYVQKGIFMGGSATVKEAMVEDIRRARNPGYERVVIDLKEMDQDAATSPYYQVAIEPETRRVVVSLFGRIRSNFSVPKTKALFLKSPVVNRIELYPQADPEVWMASFQLKDAPAVEVFELASPRRLILDFKMSAPERLTEASPAKKARRPKPAAPNPEEHAEAPALQKKEAPAEAVEPFSDFEGVPEVVDN